jgi:hypothetical protein
MINFVDYFEKIDEIMSVVELFIGKGDIELDECFDKIMRLLENNCCITDRHKNLIDIASMQNFDGSFCFCLCFKRKYSLIALKRFLTEGDLYVHRKQIEKLFSFLNKVNLLDDEKADLSECMELMKKL